MTQETVVATSGTGARRGRAPRPGTWVLASILVATVLAGAVRPAAAQSQFPKITLWAFPGVPSSTGADSTVSRKVTIRWLRDRVAEARPDFGGYHIWRQFTNRDTTNMELLRRFSVRKATAADSLAGQLTSYDRRDTLLWHFPDDQDTLQFVDPDSTGNFVKTAVCKQFDQLGRCIKADSVFTLQNVPGPHEGYAVYYTITYGQTDRTGRDTEDMFVPDSLDNYARCGTAGVPNTCPNLNNKLTNLMATPIYVAGPAEPNLQGVIVVPNPYRGHERWDQPGTARVQFQNLPANVTVRIYSVAGDLVRELTKSDALSGNLDWDLKNADLRDVASGIYLFHVTSSQGFEQKGHFVVIR